MKSSAKSIGTNIRILRTQKNMTQDALAEALFVTRQTVSNYETGRSYPDLEKLTAIADILETDVNTLIYGLPEPPDRQAERMSLIRASVCALIFVAASAAAMLFFRWFEGRHRYIYYPRYAAGYTLFPACWFSIGWLLMELIHYFVGVKPVPEKASRIGRRILWGLLIFYSLFAVPMVIFQLTGLVLFLTTGSVSLSWGLFPPYNRLNSLVMELTWKHPYLFLIPAAAYRLFRKKPAGK